MVQIMNIAIFPGSFDPFTIGHLEIALKAARLFDLVYIAIEINDNKVRTTDPEKIKTLIETRMGVEGVSNVKVIIHSGLTIDLCDKVSAKYIIRGLRDEGDYIYEEKIAKASDTIAKLQDAEIETVYLRASSAMASISSSLVRTMENNGMDAGRFKI